MAESNSVDSLRPGQEGIRDNGEKDKHYFAPSSVPVFSSRDETRLSFKSKKKRGLKQPWKIIAVEKVSTKDLPPGWIGEIIVKERDRLIRRDPYYIDPVSKTVLRSLKAVSRHLRTTDLGTPSQNSKGVGDEGLENHSTFSTRAINRGKLLTRSARRQINFDQSSDMNKTVHDHRRVGKVLAAKESVEDGLKRDEIGNSQPRLRKSSRKKEPDSLRRSKRLAGIELDQIVELKPRTRTRRVSTTKESPEPNQPKIEPGTKCDSEMSKHLVDNSVTSGGQIVKLEAVIGCDEKQTCPDFPLKSQTSHHLPLGELLMDPCIAFAIKTLTGVNFDSSESSEILLRNTSSDHHSSVNSAKNLSGAGDHMIDSKTVEKSAVFLGENAGNVESKTNSTELPFQGSWKDPYIDFAIRTLTDEIPLVYGPNIRQHKLSSPKTQGSDETSFNGVNGLD